MDLARFMFASMVVLVHASVLTGHPALAPLHVYISSDIAVQSFFVISGLLIVQSYERSRSLRSYFGKRVRRVYPAYLLVILLCAAGGLALTRLTASEYLGAGTLKYLVANLTFLNFLLPALPGVFEDNPMSAVNGSLWTLKVEVAFYLAVPLIVLAVRRWGAVRVLVPLYLLSVLYMALGLLLAERTQHAFFDLLAKQLPGQLTYFCVGAGAYYLAQRRALPILPMIVVGALLLLASQFFLPLLLRPVGLGLLVLGAAYGPWLGNWSRYGDFSYGIYIVHFPIIQTLVALRVLEDRPWLLLLFCYALAVLVSVPLWHLVEKQFLRSDSHYRNGEGPGVDPVPTNTSGRVNAV
nr:acyltransferase [Sphingomonas sp. CFBP 13720]